MPIFPVGRSPRCGPSSSPTSTDSSWTTWPSSSARCASTTSATPSASTSGLGRDLNQRDTIAVKHTVSGLLKLLYPHEDYDKEAVRECLEYALEAGGASRSSSSALAAWNFTTCILSYIDLETNEEKIVGVLEQGGDIVDPGRPAQPRFLYTPWVVAAVGIWGSIAWRPRSPPGPGSCKLSGLGSNTGAKESVKVGFDFFRANIAQIQASLEPVRNHNLPPACG